MMEPAKKRTTIRRIILLSVLLPLMGMLAIVVNYRAIADIAIDLSFRPSLEMSQMIDDIELTDKGERIVRASRAELQGADTFNYSCPNVTAETSVLGCFDDWRIYVYDVKNEELDGIKEAVLAHELLHAYWRRERSHAKNLLEPVLRSVYEEHKDLLGDHMDAYSDEHFVDELHSIIGVELDPSELPKELRDHYAEVFRNHSKIHSYFAAYNGKFTALQNEMNEQLKQINEMRTLIDLQTDSYSKQFAKLSEDIETFNQRADNGYYTNENQFNADRAALVARQAALDGEYQKLSNLVDEANAIVKKYNENIARSTELYGSINSNFKKEESIQK